MLFHSILKEMDKYSSQRLTRTGDFGGRQGGVVLRLLKDDDLGHPTS